LNNKIVHKPKTNNIAKKLHTLQKEIGIPRSLTDFFFYFEYFDGFIIGFL